MKNNRLKITAGVLLIFLGLCHQTVHILFALNPDKPPLVQQMIAYKIEMMGTHSLLEFHGGVSVMTGQFIISL